MVQSSLVRCPPLPSDFHFNIPLLPTNQPSNKLLYHPHNRTSLYTQPKPSSSSTRKESASSQNTTQTTTQRLKTKGRLNGRYLIKQGEWAVRYEFFYCLHHSPYLIEFHSNTPTKTQTHRRRNHPIRLTRNRLQKRHRRMDLLCRFRGRK